MYKNKNVYFNDQLTIIVVYELIKIVFKPQEKNPTKQNFLKIYYKGYTTLIYIIK